MPDNAQTLTNLETLLRCVVLVVPVEANIYDKLCLVCGSNAVENIGKKSPAQIAEQHTRFCAKTWFG